MLQLKNLSPFSPALALFANENGVDSLYIIIKGTFNMTDEVTLAEEQIPPQAVDEYWGEPNESSLKYLSEMHLQKPATDIVVNGHAYSPNGQAVSHLDCGIKVGDHSKIIRVFGDRYWQGKQFSAAEPFVKMPLIYENAYGGAYVDTVNNGKGDPEEQTVLHTGNPVGRGYRKLKAQAVSGEKLPNLEDPKQLIRLPDDQPEPAGFGFISPTWKPRIDYVGTYDEAWQNGRAPYLPIDFDNRYFNAAASELIVPGYLRGGELIRMANLAKQGSIQFELPRCGVRCEINTPNKIEAPEVNLECVLFEPDENRFTMTWRAQFQCDKTALKISEVEIQGALNAGIRVVT